MAEPLVAAPAADDDVLERGDIQFCFQPTVQPADAVEYALGVAAFFAILSPAGRDLHRRMRVGKKRMPHAPRERFWARIERVGTLDRALGGKLEPETYTTKTRGERYQPAARLIATGAYAFVRHGDHVHLDYEVEPLPFEAAPEQLQLELAGSPLVLFEAPERGDGAEGDDSGRRGGRATWTHRGSIAQLDEEGAELVLVGGHTPDAGA